MTANDYFAVENDIQHQRHLLLHENIILLCPGREHFRGAVHLHLHNLHMSKLFRHRDSRVIQLTRHHKMYVTINFFLRKTCLGSGTKGHEG